MNISKSRLSATTGLCAELGPDDGIDPRYLKRGNKSKTFSRKDWQLCKEAEQLLALVFSGDMADPLLRDLQVLAVEPEGDGRQLCVTVAHEEPSAYAEAEILTALSHAQGHLRTELARSIHRKRVPVLRFRYVRKGG